MQATGCGFHVVLTCRKVCHGFAQWRLERRWIPVGSISGMQTKGNSGFDCVFFVRYPKGASFLLNVSV